MEKFENMMKLNNYQLELFDELAGVLLEAKEEVENSEIAREQVILKIEEEQFQKYYETVPEVFKKIVKEFILQPPKLK